MNYELFVTLHIEIMLELHNVILKPLRQTVSLTVNDGQLACISAPKGTGKTTLLRAIMGFLPIDGGHISIDGELLTPLSAPYFRRQMAYVPSRLVPIPGQDKVSDVRKLLFGLAANCQMKQPESEGHRLWSDLTAAEQYLELLQSTAGQQRRLVLIDEPETALDWETADMVAHLLRKLTNEGSSVLIVSNMPSVMNLTNNVITL